MNCDTHFGFRPGCIKCANDRIETLDWLANLGEVWTCMTVSRAGFPSLVAAQRALCRAGRWDLVARLRDNHKGVGLGV